MVITNNGVTAKLVRPQHGLDQTVDRSNMDFADMLYNAIKSVDSLEKAAEASAIALAVGDVDNLHQVMIDAQKAEIALQFTLQIRNKIIDAYNEVMRMQI
jgi:flagellar hook-basal body complex protein FliE